MPDWEEMTPEERLAVGVEAYQEYGRQDVLLAEYPDRATRYDFTTAVGVFGGTPQIFQKAYEQGKQEAEQEKQTSPAMFYLSELHKMMTGDEWYGSDFDEPKWILQRVMDMLKARS